MKNGDEIDYVIILIGVFIVLFWTAAFIVGRALINMQW